MELRRQWGKWLPFAGDPRGVGAYRRGEVRGKRERERQRWPGDWGFRWLATSSDALDFSVVSF